MNIVELTDVCKTYPSVVYLMYIIHKKVYREEHSWQQKKLLMLNH